MEQKQIIEKLLKASNEISKNDKPKANYIHLSEEYIQQKADEKQRMLEKIFQMCALIQFDQ
jgi:hypothetical protein